MCSYILSYKGIQFNLHSSLQMNVSFVLFPAGIKDQITEIPVREPFYILWY